MRMVLEQLSALLLLNPRPLTQQQGPSDGIHESGGHYGVLPIRNQTEKW